MKCLHLYLHWRICSCIIYDKSNLWFHSEFYIYVLNSIIYAQIHDGRHKVVSVTSILQFDIDVQKPDVSYMIHDLPDDLDFAEINTHQILISVPYLVTYTKSVFLQLLLVLGTRGLKD